MATALSPPPSAVDRRPAAPPALPPGQSAVVVVDQVQGLEPHQPAWDDLAAAAIEPNAFHESWMLLPAVQYLAGPERPFFVLVYTADPRRPQGPPLLTGFFPLVRDRRYKGVPVSVTRIWRHLH